ncbi:MULTISPECIES: hypothetical protein [Actinomycetes]|uniref:hypothetical protein n=1 Tax=Actinomycetes TaxID=1760 RepID=UPI0031F84284
MKASWLPSAENTSEAPSSTIRVTVPLPGSYSQMPWLVPPAVRRSKARVPAGLAVGWTSYADAGSWPLVSSGSGAQEPSEGP